MATLAPPAKVSTPEEVEAAEKALMEIYLDHLETLPADKQQTVISDLRANAIALGE